MKNFRQKFMEVLQSLGLTDKAKSTDEAKGLNADDWKNIRENYKSTHGTDFAEDMAAEEANAQKAEQHDAALVILNAATPAAENTDGGEGEGTQANADTPVDLTEQVNIITQENAENKIQLAEANQKIALLSDKIEPKTPEAKVVTGKSAPFQKAHTETHAFGIDHEMYSMDKRWNKITANTAYATLNQVTSMADEKEVKKSFAQDLTSFGKMFAGRYAELKDQNLLGRIKSAAFDVDYSELESQFKNQYVVRRIDALIAQILQSKSISDMFPVRSGVQDMDVITNVLFSEVSCAWQQGKIFKGDADLQPEYGHVDDVSIKVLFEPLTKMERQYIGYLNTEGSNPVKMSMIEWYAMGLLTQAITERYRRAVRGIFFKPETGVAGSYLNASTGLLHTLIRYQNQCKLYAHEAAAYRSYTDVTFFATAKAFLKKVKEDLIDQEIEDYTFCLNYQHRNWFIDNLRDEFGQDTDFTGVDSYANVFPDYNVKIYWLPNMNNNDYTMLLTKAGNIQQIENIPGEMLGLIFQEDFEDITVRNRSKEGTSAAFVGPKFADKASLVANAYLNQHIYINKAVVALADGETAPDAADGYRFITVANAAATEILDVANAKKGPGYYIEIGSTTNASTILKALKFSEITAAWTPTAVGDYILLVLNNAGDKFFELERMVGGVRSVNKTIQPTLPESRS